MPSRQVGPGGLLLCLEVSRAELEQTGGREVRSPATSGASIPHPLEGPCMSTRPVPHPARPGHSVAPGPSRCLPVKVDASHPPAPKTRQHPANHAESRVQLPPAKFCSVHVSSRPVVDSAVPPAGERGSVRSGGNHGLFLVFTTL